MEDFQVAVHVFAGAACIGGVPDVHMVVAMTISGRKKIHITRLIQMDRHEQHGAIGTSPRNRHTGVGAVYYIRSITVRNSSNTRVLS